MPRTLILGAGFGGIACAVELRRLDPEREIVLVDRRDTFLMGLANLALLDGRRKRGEGERKLAELAKKSIRVVKAGVTRIDPLARSAVLDTREVVTADDLVIALGAELVPAAVPGLAEHAYNLYDPAGILSFRDALLAAGAHDRVLILVTGLPFKCPPAPYEAAMIATRLLAEKGGTPSVTLATPEPMPMPVTGPTCGAAVVDMLEERGIVYRPQRKVRELVEGLARFEEGPDIAFDICAAVPPHRATAALKDAGLLGESGWVPVDRATAEVRHPKLATSHVWAIGDATAIKLAVGKPLPKAGVFAEAEGIVVARRIVGDDARFEGKGGCYLETGDGRAIEVTGDFYALPEPRVGFDAPSAATLAKKAAFETGRLARWFG
ncbi:MAG: NAD(P)/FAD-dependent oxidoreductase [Thermoplasmatota archaeon]